MSVVKTKEVRSKRKRNTISMNTKEPVSAPQIQSVDVTTEALVLGPGIIAKVDHAVVLDGLALISGWSTQGVMLEVPGLEHQLAYKRPDVEARTGLAARAFIFVVKVEKNAIEHNLYLLYRGQRSRAAINLKKDTDSLRSIVGEQKIRWGQLIHYLYSSPKWGLLFARLVHPADTPLVKGHIEHAGCVGTAGALLVGWAISRHPDETLWLTSENGHWRPLREAIRFSRSDIHEVHGKHFGQACAEAGFLCALFGTFSPGMMVSVVAASARGLIRLHETTLDEYPTDARAYARWAFDLPTPLTRFTERMERHDGRLLELLIQTKRDESEQEAEISQFGPRPDRPLASVIVPLYGRHDFIEHQLVEFSQDPEFKDGLIELLYIIDDETLVEPTRDWLPLLFDLYGVPMTLIWGHRNRGYSGANNLGARSARADALVFLNSDVFPQEARWVSRLAGTLEGRPDLAAVGARLLYPTGSLQHLGIRFFFDTNWGVWLNKHPAKGLEPPSGGKTVLTVQAATGACLAVRRRDFDTVGGFDEGYLIGDFEDSDLCLKLRDLGEIAVLPDTNLIHLERQSFRCIASSPSFREKVTHFNAWRHHRRWSNRIAAMAEPTP